MAKITGSGETEIGYLDGLVFSGNKTVERITCSEPWMEEPIRAKFDSYNGTIANDYHPKAGTMTLAYLFMVELFGEESVTVTGKLETIPNEPGVIY